MDVQGEILSLLRSKIRCLEDLQSANARFSMAATRGDFSELDAFMERRRTALSGFELFRRRAEEMIKQIPADQRTASAMEEIQAAIEKKNELTRQIMELDEQLMAALATEKNKVAKELAQNTKSQKVIIKFKSNWAGESGEELDKKL